MKSIKKILFLPLVYIYSAQAVLASDNVLGLSNDKIKNGDIHIDDIPGILKHAINFFLGIAGTIAVIFVIVWAYKLLFGSVQSDKSKWRETILAALWGFSLAALSWLIVRFIIDNLS